MQQAFQVGGTTTTISATQTSGTAALTSGTNSVRVVNAGANTAFLKFGTTTATATTSDMPILAGVTEVFGKGREDIVAAICDTGLTTTLYFTCSEGI